jgi:lactoylglutathione lyase
MTGAAGSEGTSRPGFHLGDFDDFSFIVIGRPAHLFASGLSDGRCVVSCRCPDETPCPFPHFTAIETPETKPKSRQYSQGARNMRYLHTMLRVRNLDTALKFYQDALGLKEVRRIDNDKAKFTLVFLCAAEDEGLLKQSPKNRGAPLVELTYNWDEEKYGEDRYFGHLAYEVDDIYATCDRLMKKGITINRPPRDGQMAFIRSPDLHSIELLQKGDAKPPAEPWASMPNTGHW